MGCANCTHNITSNGLVVINDQSISDDLKAFSLEKGQFPSSKTNSTSDESNQINLLVNSSHLPLSFPDIFPSTAMLKQINKARTDPLSYISIIEKYKQYIKTKNNRSYLCINRKKGLNINLYKGKEEFDNCINFLKIVAKRKKRLSPLIMKEELKIPFPVNSKENCVDREFLRNVLQFKTEENKNEFNIIDFHYDIGYDDVEISTMLQIVDDTNSNYQRRRNIFNEKAKYVGITEGSISDNIKCYYLLFAN